MQNWLKGRPFVIFAMHIKQRCNQNQPENRNKSSFEPCRDDFHISLLDERHVARWPTSLADLHITWMKQ